MLHKNNLLPPLYRYCYFIFPDFVNRWRLKHQYGVPAPKDIIKAVKKCINYARRQMKKTKHLNYILKINILFHSLIHMDFLHVVMDYYTNPHGFSTCGYGLLQNPYGLSPSGYGLVINPYVFSACGYWLITNPYGFCLNVHSLEMSIWTH